MSNNLSDDISYGTFLFLGKSGVAVGEKSSRLTGQFHLQIKSESCGAVSLMIKNVLPYQCFGVFVVWI